MCGIHNIRPCPENSHRVGTSFDPFQEEVERKLRSHDLLRETAPPDDRLNGENCYYGTKKAGAEINEDITESRERSDV
jgi:hypothetical protein